MARASRLKSQTVGSRRGSAAQPQPHSSKSDPSQPALARLQKVMASAGIGSRRKCEELISQGRVEVDGRAVVEPGTKVGPHQQIRVDGTLLRQSQPVYYLVNKPAGTVSTSYDPAGRMRVIDLVPEGQRVYTVGRLDRMSEGLMLITNDGELAHRLTHPRFGIEKTYQVSVAGEPTREQLEQLTQGIHLADGIASARRVVVLAHHGKSTRLELVLREGKNREIRRILARIGHKVLRLRRVAIGGIKLQNLPLGAHRRLTNSELERLRAATHFNTRQPTAAEPSSGRPAVTYRRRVRPQAKKRRSPAAKERK